MSLQNFEYIVRELKNHTQGIVMQFAGETLLHKDIVKMISHASKNGLLVTMDTNATLLTPALAEGLIESGLDTIVVGLDGATKSSYEKWRVNAKFEDTLQNIRTLCDLKRQKKKRTPIVEIQCIANRYNQDELAEVKRMSGEIGADRFMVMSLVIPSHIYDDETCKKMAKEFMPTRPDVKSRYNRPRPSSCHFWARNSVILVDGTVTMCCYDLNGEYSLGNIFQEGFLNIWNSEKYRHYRKNLIINKKLPLCARCPHK